MTNFKFGDKVHWKKRNFIIAEYDGIYACVLCDDIVLEWITPDRLTTDQLKPGWIKEGRG